jgi:hypothetical protein
MQNTILTRLRVYVCGAMLVGSAAAGLGAVLPLSSALAAGAESPVLQGEDLKSAVKLPPKALGPEHFDELDNSEGTAATAGVQPAAVVGSGCILPFFKIRYGVALVGRGVFHFVTVPARRFDVVMTIDFPGFHRRVDRFFAGGIESYNVIKNFSARVAGKLTISGAGASYGCFVWRITP